MLFRHRPLGPDDGGAVLMAIVLSKPDRREGERLSLELVESTILWLMQEGKQVSERSVRDVLGGSPNAILPLMRTWYAERAPELLAGRIVVMDQSSVPEPVLMLYRAILEEAGRAADERVANRVEALEAERAGQEQREAALKRFGEELEARGRTLEAVLPALRAELEIARAEVGAQKAATERVQQEARERAAAMEAEVSAARAAADESRRSAASLGILKESAEGRAGQLAEALEAVKAELSRSREDGDRFRAELADVALRHQGQLDALQASAAGQRAAHQREIEAIKERHADAAARWADSRLRLEAELTAAVSGQKAAEEAQRSAEGLLRVTEEMLGTAQDQLEAERKLRKKDRDRIAKLEDELRGKKTAGSGPDPTALGAEGPPNVPTGEAD